MRRQKSDKPGTDWHSAIWYRFSTVAVVLAAIAASGAALAQLESPHLAPVESINAAVEAQWSDFGLVAAPLEEDAKWCRRLFLDVIGRIPTLDELKAFQRSRDPRKRALLVDSLLDDSRYTAEYAEHWATVWSNILIGRSGGTQPRSLTSREGLGKYLRDSFASNKPYDRMAMELVTATGTTKPGAPGFNGATNFLVDKVNQDDATLATSATSRIFLGMQVQCTQCHNHPFNEWKQQKFWEFNAFFRQTRGLRRFVSGSNDIDFAELVDEDFAGESGQPSEAEIYYQERNGLTRVAYPVFLDGTPIERSGYVQQVVRRQELGKLIAGSDLLAKMMVNRMWSHFLCYSFTRSMEDLGPHSLVSHPELLEELAEAFRHCSYDVKALMRWIVLSKPYQLSSQIGRGQQDDDPTTGAVPRFSHFYLRPMSAEQLYRSLVMIGGQAQGSLEQQQRTRERWLEQYVVAFGTDEGDERNTLDGSIPQALMMFNGELMRRATSVDSDSWLSSVLGSNLSFGDRVHWLFTAGLGRRARGNELGIANALRVSRGSQEQALQDLWWAVLNSNEFILIQ